jgi:RecG-like helicase
LVGDPRWIHRLAGDAMATAEGYLRRLTRRLTDDPEQLDVDEMNEEAAGTGAQKAVDCQRGQEVTMVGTLRSVEANAKGCAGGIKAELFDGTEAVMLVWLGQRRIPGIESGRTLRVHGRVGKLENGTKAIYNPHYEIQK